MSGGGGEKKGGQTRTHTERLWILLYTGLEIMVVSHSIAKTVKDRSEPISYLDSTSKNTLKQFIRIIKMSGEGFNLNFSSF
jgi:hypothetical protein